MNKEKVRELAKELFNGRMTMNDYVEAITEWLEQNQPEPIVVGLSDEQVDDFSFNSFFINPAYAKELSSALKEWQKTQTFAEPCGCDLNVSQIHKDQFKDLQVAYKVLAERERELEQLKKEHEQLKAAYDKLEDDSNADYVSLEEVYFDLQKDYEKLEDKLKSQQFTPSWDDAPDWANWASVALFYSEDEPTNKNAYRIFSNHRRPKPTPQVEVGQVWRKNEIDYEIYGLSTVTSLGEKVPAVDYVVKSIDEESDDFVVSTRTLKSFLAQFEFIGEMK